MDAATAGGQARSGAVGIRWVPVPTGGDHGGGPLVPAVRPLVAGCGGVARRARRRGRSGHRLRVGAAVHAAVRWCSPPAARPCRHAAGSGGSSTRPTGKISGEPVRETGPKAPPERPGSPQKAGTKGWRRPAREDLFGKITGDSSMPQCPQAGRIRRRGAARPYLARSADISRCISARQRREGTSTEETRFKCSYSCFR